VLEKRECGRGKVYDPEEYYCLLQPQNTGWGLVAHTCNPNYSGGSNQEDQGLKLAQANGLGRLYLKKIHHKKGGLVEWLKVEALTSNPSTSKKL
jgi:hypothetical protein